MLLALSVSQAVLYFVYGDRQAMIYENIVFLHLLLFVFWLGGDVGVFILGQQSRRSDVYSLTERMTILKILTMVDMAPRTCIALMVPVSLTVASAGGWWAVPAPMLWGGWFVGATLLVAAWTGFINHGSAKAAIAKKVDFWLQIAMAIFYGSVAVSSLTGNGPIADTWLAAKTMLYALIFVTAIMIDLSYRPIGPALQKLIADETNAEAEAFVLSIQNKTRKWVLTIYGLLFVIGYIGAVKPF